MSDKAQQFYNQLRKAVETDQLTLPTLPEVAIKIREAVDSQDNSAEQMAEILSQDPSISTRLLQLANSPLYRARAEIDSIQMAITRLGTRVVRDLVLTLALRQIYQTSSDSLTRQFKELWLTSVEVAAICRLLASQQQGLEAEQALLAGLIHNIGALPIIQLADKDPDLVNNANELQSIICEIQNEVGNLILSFWNLPAHLINVVSMWNNFSRCHEGDADYVDIVQAAIAQSGHTSYANIPGDWSQIPAFDKLSLDTNINFIESDENKIRIDKTRQSLISI
ncbi:MAG: HDOD domain-containing protein [Gammaproteobacteria bacterium]|nr:HDOD domain-containing protein [Gammaproteobacteria bacterium]